MRTRNDTVTTVDPEDAAALRAWSARRAAAQQALMAAQAELARLTTTLGQPPASTQLAQLTAAQSAAGRAQAAADTAAAQAATDATTATRYEANDLAQAQTAVDTATRNLSLALAALLRDASTTSALTATVDGLALRQRYLDGSADPARWDHTTLPFLAHAGDAPLDPELVLPAVGSQDFDRLLAVLGRLDAGVDAVADLVTAESVHHLVDGNLVRSGAALDIAASGSVPDAFDVIRTPQSGEVVTHRLLLVTDPAAAGHWTADPGPAALADPLLAVWLTELLPPPSAVEVTVSRRDGTGTTDHPYAVTLDRLGLDPIELIRVCGDPGELAQRLAQLARRHWSTGPLGAAALTGAVVVDAGSGAYQLSDLIAAAESARLVLAGSRALVADDLRGPTDPRPPPAADVVTTLTARIAAVEAALTATLTVLDQAVAGTDLLDLGAALLAAAGWMVPGAAPQLDQDPFPLAVVQAQALRVRADLARRLPAEAWQPTPGDTELTVRRARDRLTALLGRPLPILVPLDAPAGPVWSAAVADRRAAARLTGAEAPTLRRWLGDYARVRPAVASLADAYELAETLGLPGTLDLAAGQVLAGSTGASPTSWYGASPTPPPGLVSLVLQRSFAGTPVTLTGLAVDGWTQRVPGTTQQSGVAFHVDAPDAAPPQVAMVAVAPDLTPGRTPGAWDLETLADVVVSAFALAQDRAVAAENATVHGITVRGT